MPSTKKDNTKSTPSTGDLTSLNEKVTDIANLVIQSKDRYVGILNVGCDFVYFLPNGGQKFIHSGERHIIDGFTFKGIMDREGWRMGHILRDDSILLPNMIPFNDVPISKNAIFDHEIEILIDNFSKCEKFINACDSPFTIERIMEVMNKQKRKYSELLLVCEDRLFLLLNKLPSNFYTANLETLENIIREREWPDSLFASRGEHVDEVREKIVQFLKD
jgi:hypothetical protein